MSNTGRLSVSIPTAMPREPEFECACFHSCTQQRIITSIASVALLGLVGLCIYALLYQPSLLGNRTIALFTSYACLTIALITITSMAVKSCRRRNI